MATLRPLAVQPAASRYCGTSGGEQSTRGCVRGWSMHVGAVRCVCVGAAVTGGFAAACGAHEKGDLMLGDGVEEAAALCVDGQEQALLLDGEVGLGVERQQPVQTEAGVAYRTSRAPALHPRLALHGHIGAGSDGARTPEGAAPGALHRQGGEGRRDTSSRVLGRALHPTRAHRSPKMTAHRPPRVPVSGKVVLQAAVCRTAWIAHTGTATSDVRARQHDHRTQED